MDEHFANTLLNKREQYGITSGVVTRIKFLKHKEKIKELYDEGMPLRAIWVWMKEENDFPFGYDYFVKLCRKHIEPAYKQPPQKASDSSSTKKEVSAKPKTPKTNSFEFNPTPDKDELI